MGQMKLTRQLQTWVTFSYRARLRTLKPCSDSDMTVLRQLLTVLRQCCVMTALSQCATTCVHQFIRVVCALTSASRMLWQCFDSVKKALWQCQGVTYVLSQMFVPQPQFWLWYARALIVLLTHLNARVAPNTSIHSGVLVLLLAGSSCPKFSTCNDKLRYAIIIRGAAEM